MTTFDEDFTDEDMDAALEWQAEQALKCAGCGGFTDETTAVGRDDDFDADVFVCHRCAAGDRAQRAYQNDGGDMAGIKRRVWESD